MIIRSIFQRKKLCTAILATLATTSTLSYAAEQALPDEVIVVGSRLARGAQAGATPVQVIDRQTIDNSGYNNLQQIFERSTAAGNGTFSTRGNNQDSTANGAAAVSLRGMGADATLVLVNGRRVAISSFAENITTNFVDINNLPVSAIERVEVLKDGASAIYGSDAVAGVVNIVLRDDFEGTQFSAGYGDTLDTSSAEQTFSAIWGINGDNDSNLTVIFDYFNNGNLMNKDRGDLGSANQSANGGQDFRSSRGYPGRFIVNGVTTRDPGCPAGSIAGQTCLYDYGPWNLLTPESERTGLLALGHTQLSENIEFFTEIGIQHNNSIAQGAPTPLDESAGLTVPVTHPNNPFPAATSIRVGRYRTVDAGARQWGIESDNLRAVVGLRGEINDWNWEASAQRARSESTQTGSRNQGWVRTDFLQQEINAGRYNPFRGVQNPASVIDAISTSLVRQGESNLTAYDFTVTGDLFDLAAGTVAMAAGVEYREEDAADTPDDQFVRGLIFGTESVSAAAKRDITSLFVEFGIPVMENLDVTVAGRYDDYSDFGSSTNPMINGLWSPNDMVSVRASWGQGFRAPSLAQIGLGPSQESQFFVDTFGCAVNPVYCASTDYTIIFAGNPNLDAEESESYNLGVLLEPIADLSLSLDYWEIEQEGKIDEVPFGFLYNQSCSTQNSTVCVRSAPLGGQPLGVLQSINSGFTNIGEQTVSGVDLNAVYSGFELHGGEILLSLDYTYLAEFERVELNPAGTAFQTTDLAGEYEYPQYRWVATGEWNVGDFGFTASLAYMSEFEDTPDINFDGTLDYDTNSSRSVDTFTTLNLQASYTGFENINFVIGADNVLDEEPPFAIGDGDGDLYGYVSDLHSPRGQFVYGKLTYQF